MAIKRNLFIESEKKAVKRDIETFEIPFSKLKAIMKPDFSE